MFGYIQPLEGQLRVCELETYRAVYCGLCRSLGKRFGPLSRCTLSYDFTFITMLALSLREEEPVFVPARCPMNPFHRRPHLAHSETTEWAAEIAVLLLHEKCLDNRMDGGFWGKMGWGMLSVFSGRLADSAARQQPLAAAIVRDMTRAQQEIEATDASIDEACNPTATALGKLLALLSTDQVEQRILERLGYMLGRYIYLSDALDDLVADQKSGSFNPLKQHPAPSYLTGMMNMTLAEIGNAYALLSPRHFGEILDNILFLGLPAKAELLLQKGNSPAQPL